MNHLLQGNPSSNSRGITLIEILLVVGLLVILLSFAVPSISGAATKVEMTSAVENVQYSIHSARQMARMNESPVTMTISPAVNEEPQTLSFSSRGEKGALNGLQVQDFSLPPEIMLVSASESFLFDEKGLVKNPGQILLISSADETVSATIEIK